MCEPVSIIMGIGAVVGAVSAGVSADAQAKESDAKQREMVANQARANVAAMDALRRGGEEAGRARTKGTQLAAQQRVAFSNSGVEAGTGTAQAVVGDTARITETDALTLQNNAAREAWGFKQQGEQFSLQAELEKQRGGRAVAGTVLGGVGNFASGAAGAYGAYRQVKG